MGWQDRDWAKFSDDELNAIYGGGGRRQPPRGARPAPRPGQIRFGGTPGRPGRRISPTIIWSVIVLVVALAGAYALGRPSRNAPLLVQQPTYVYGHSILFGGHPAACTEIAYNTAIHAWVCLVVQDNSNRLPVFEPRAYDGPCADAVADQTEGRWVCHGSTPLPSSDLPTTRVF